MCTTDKNTFAFLGLRAYDDLHSSLNPLFLWWKIAYKRVPPALRIGHPCLLDTKCPNGTFFGTKASNAQGGGTSNDWKSTEVPPTPSEIALNMPKYKCKSLHFFLQAHLQCRKR